MTLTEEWTGDLNSKGRIFFALPMTGLVDPVTNRITQGYKSWIQGVLSHLREKGYEVKCVLEEENWGSESVPPAEALIKDFNYVQWADIFLFYIGNPVSAGGLVEMGIAIPDKKIVLITGGDFSWDQFPDGRDSMRKFKGAFPEVSGADIEKPPSSDFINSLITAIKQAKKLGNGSAMKNETGVDHRSP